MYKSTYRVSKLDCPSEEQMIRMKLEPLSGIEQLVFDIENRTLEVYHKGEPEPIAGALDSLDLGAERQTTEAVDHGPVLISHGSEHRALWTVLIINFGFFLVEIIAGLIAGSMGLLGDSLDMLADSFVYGLSLMAVGKALSYKQQVARLSGWGQLLLALLGFLEVIRRFLGMTEMPVFEVMIVVAAFALIGNVISLMVINRAKSDEIHMQASAIFTSNDIIVNLGVITAGILVKLTATAYPDLVIGAILFMVVARGAFRIMKLAR